MVEALLHAAAFACALAGGGWLALSMNAHWAQVRGKQALEPRTVRTLRVLGAGALAASLLVCFVVDHPTMAPLVWVMTLTAAVFVVAFTFAFAPKAMAALVAWVPRAP